VIRCVEWRKLGADALAWQQALKSGPYGYLDVCRDRWTIIGTSSATATNGIYG
jgi:hypothetical protein